MAIQTIERSRFRKQVLDDLERKMVFVAGPRQVGKTTLAKSLPGGLRGYLNWDDPDDRSRILERRFRPSRLWVFDEIHRHRPWRNLLKGVWDGRSKGRRILVTGSARLDLYHRGGDSLQGRYHFLRLHPLSVAELGIASREDFRSLLTLGGFPEPFASGSEAEARRWSREHRARIVREEVVSLEQIHDLGTMEVLAASLPARVGSPLSVNSLREDLQVAHRTVARWLTVLDALYMIFRVPPFGAPRLRAVKKEQKHYHWDWSAVPGPARFENLVASHLLKWVHWRQDVEGRDLELRYFRDVDRREVDFVVVEGREPVLLVECKWGDDDVDRSLRYLHARFPEAEAWQVHATGRADHVTAEGIRVAPAIELLRRLV